MFNYLGKIVEYSNDAETDALSDYGIATYNVVVPALADGNTVRAAVLTLPGVVVGYDVGDIVLVGEIEDKVPGGFFYIIIGKIQKAKEAQTLSNSLVRLSVDNVTVKGGSIETPVNIVSKNTNNATTEISFSDLWNQLALLQSYKI